MRAEHRALVALQGPKAAEVLAAPLPEGVPRCPSCRRATTSFDGLALPCVALGLYGRGRLRDLGQVRPCRWRSGRRCCAMRAVKPIGLGARNSLRLEAGLCLYGHDIDTTTSPVEAALTWSIQKRRREEGGFPGAERIQRELAEGPSRKRVGLLPDGRAPAREGAEIAGEGRPQDRHRHLGRLRPDARRPARHGLCRGTLRRPARSSTSSCAASTLPAKVARHALRAQSLLPTARGIGLLSSRGRNENSKHGMNQGSGDERHQLHQGPRIYPPRGRHRHRRHHRLRPEPTRRRRLCRAAGDRQGGHARAARRPWSRASRRRPTSSRRSPARWSTSTASSKGRPSTVNEDPLGKGWFLKIKVKDKAELDALMSEAEYQEYLKTLVLTAKRRKRSTRARVLTRMISIRNRRSFAQDA